MATKLRAVKSEVLQSVQAAARSGDERALLVALRDRLARAITAEDTLPRELAALSRQLREIMADIDAFDERARQQAREESGADESWGVTGT